jgi:hypothetical protein
VALAESAWITLDDLPPAVRGDYAEMLLPSLVRDDTMRAWGSRYARLVLETVRRQQARACRVLDISYHTLQSYLRYGADPSRRPRPAGRLGRPMRPDTVELTTRAPA